MMTALGAQEPIGRKSAQHPLGNLLKQGMRLYPVALAQQARDVAQVGHDLHALKVEQLEIINGELSQEVRALRRLIAPRGANA